MPTVLIGADICPIEGNRPLFEAGNASGLFNDLLPEFRQADLVIANLECPLIDRKTPILKTGPVFGEPSSCLNGIQQAGIDVLSLANNHILDHGPAGLLNTMEVCAKAGIGTVGAGQNLAQARKILVKEAGGIRVGILAMAEHEFSIATATTPGANPLDPIEFVRNVKANCKSFEHLLVLLHGGDEFHVPTPRLRDTCRFMVEMGATAVVVQHPHVLGGYEDYLDGHIIYGQGALIMDEAIYRKRKSFHEGFLVKLSLSRERESKLELVPFVQSAPGPGARRLRQEEESEFRARLGVRAQAIKDPAFVEAEWLRFCQEHRHSYLSSLLGHNRLLCKLNAAGLLEKTLHGRLPLLRAKNMVTCETHREAIETLFRHGLL